MSISYALRYYMGMDTQDRTNATTTHASLAHTTQTSPTCDAYTVGSILLGRYQIIEVNNAGAFGDVYIVKDPRLKRRLAIKRIPIDKIEATRALEEAQTAGMLAHPNIVVMIDFEVRDDAAYLIMEYVDGLSLAEILERGEALTPDECAHVLTSVANALAFAHENGVLHLDVKPQNILIDHSATVRLADFGMANLMSAAGFMGARGGTIGYMPPEQLSGEMVDERTDVFALASVAFEALTLIKPFSGQDVWESYDEIILGAPLQELPCYQELEDFEDELDEAQEVYGEELTIEDHEELSRLRLAASAISRLFEQGLDPSPNNRPLNIKRFGHELAQVLGDPSDGMSSLASMVKHLTRDDFADEPILDNWYDDEEFDETTDEGDLEADDPYELSDYDEATRRSGLSLDSRLKAVPGALTAHFGLLCSASARLVHTLIVASFTWWLIHFEPVQALHINETVVWICAAAVIISALVSPILSGALLLIALAITCILAQKALLLAGIALPFTLFWLLVIRRMPQAVSILLSTPIMTSFFATPLAPFLVAPLISGLILPPLNAALVSMATVYLGSIIQELSTGGVPSLAELWSSLINIWNIGQMVFAGLGAAAVSITLRTMRARWHNQHSENDGETHDFASGFIACIPWIATTTLGLYAYTRVENDGFSQVLAPACFLTICGALILFQLIYCAYWEDDQSA